MRNVLGLIVGVGTAVAGLSAAPASAGIVTRWTFNTDDNSGTLGTTSPETGSGTVTAIGGVGTAFISGSVHDPNDPWAGSDATDNSALVTNAYPSLLGSPGTSGTAGVKFALSTVGAGGPLVISFDVRQTPTSSKYIQLQLSSDGTNFFDASGGTTSIGAFGSNAPTFSTAGLYANVTGASTQTFVQNIQYTLPAGSVYEENANFAFRLVTVFAPSTSAYEPSNSAAYDGGTIRYDVVTVSAVPEPASMCLLGLGGLGLLARRRVSN